MNSRKAGEFANDPEIFQAIWKHLKSDGVEDQAANHMAAEMIHHGDDLKALSKSTKEISATTKKGDITHAAQAMAVESLESEDKPNESIRFARIYG